MRPTGGVARSAAAALARAARSGAQRNSACVPLPTPRPRAAAPLSPFSFERTEAATSFPAAYGHAGARWRNAPWYMLHGGVSSPGSTPSDASVYLYDRGQEPPVMVTLHAVENGTAAAPPLVHHQMTFAGNHSYIVGGRMQDGSVSATVYAISSGAWTPRLHCTSHTHTHTHPPHRPRSISHVLLLSLVAVDPASSSVSWAAVDASDSGFGGRYGHCVVPYLSYIGVEMLVIGGFGADHNMSTSIHTLYQADSDGLVCTLRAASGRARRRQGPHPSLTSSSSSSPPQFRELPDP